jgi:hypothetical protein
MEVCICFSGENGHHSTYEASRAANESLSVTVSSGTGKTILHQVLYV